MPADTPKGGLVHRMIRGGIALYCAHTNADSADPGVSDALAEAIGLTVRRPLEPHVPGGRTGIGRIGELADAEPFEAFVRRVAEALPATLPGVLGAGDPDRPIRTVAVSGRAATPISPRPPRRASTPTSPRTCAITPPVSTSPRPGSAGTGRAHALGQRMALVQASSAIVGAAFAGNVDSHVSTRCTDPWTVRASQQGAP